jgi:hypothetical protein
MTKIERIREWLKENYPKTWVLPKNVVNDGGEVVSVNQTGKDWDVVHALEAVLDDMTPEKIHAIYQQEARRQGDMRHRESFDDLPEHIQNYDHAFVNYFVDLIAKELGPE